ncbi:ankyrin repeat domain-containing protein [Haloferula sargassicola]|uniref:Ankyrin repeat-containing protein n=1 Tax=Haloferula sargassicola TaxID=490096 RepID=A0ABP9UT33_9BACT
MKPTPFLIASLPVAAALAFSGCKKEPGAGEREQVHEAGYEMSREALFRAAESDDIRAMKTMVSGGLSVFEEDSIGRTALHAAAGAGAIKAVDYLLDEGIKVDARDGQERTPLMEATIRSTPEMVRYLLMQGADPQAKDAEQYKPLMLAVRENRPELVAVLAPYVREDLDDALLAASILGQAEVIDELTNYGASVYCRLDDGRTPLMLAAQRGQTEAVEMLLSIGANRLTMDQDGKTAAELAREAGFEEVAMRLDGAPEAGDFELADTAELSAELMAVVDPGPPADGSAARVSSDHEVAASGGGAEMASNDDGDADPQAADEPVSGGTETRELEGAVVGRSATGAGGPQTETETSTGGGTAFSSAARQSPSASGEKPAGPVVMRSYRQRELPLRVESVQDEVATIQVVGGQRHEMTVGETIPGTKLKVVKIERRMQSGKEHGGEPTEVSVVEVEDGDGGLRRDLIVGLPALSHEPVALVEDAASGRYYVARRGQRFSTEDGDEYLVDDVRPSQLVLEDLDSGEMTTVRLVGPKG